MSDITVVVPVLRNKMIVLGEVTFEPGSCSLDLDYTTGKFRVWIDQRHCVQFDTREELNAFFEARIEGETLEDLERNTDPEMLEICHD